MEQDRIRSWKLATDDQWEAIQAYGLTLEPLASNGRAALWQQNTNSGLRFTECFDFLLKDIAKKHSNTLMRLGVAVPPAVPTAPALTGNNRKFHPLVIRIDSDVKILI